MIANCAYCGKEVIRSPSHIKRSKRIFCNHKCCGRFHKGRAPQNKHGIKVKCAWCGATLEKARWEIDKYKNHFCNNTCRGLWRSANLSGENSLTWKGGKSLYKTREWYKNNYKQKTQKRQSEPKLRIAHRMSFAIYSALKRKKDGNSWEKLVGYTSEDLKNHLEKQFINGMGWDNMGQWHIDHIIPISVFNFTKPEHEDFKRCFALTNLQPMWAVDNIKKSNKLARHFQPTLAI